MVKIDSEEEMVIALFVGTLPEGIHLADAMAMAEDEVRCSGLSRPAARELSGRLIAKYVPRKTV